MEFLVHPQATIEFELLKAAIFNLERVIDGSDVLDTD